MSELWDKKNECHKWFDSLWKNHEERDVYYTRLSNELGIPYEECHFSLMNMGQLDKAIAIIKRMWLEKFDK